MVASICANCCWCLLLLGIVYYTGWYLMAPNGTGGYGFSTTTASGGGGGSGNNIEEVEVIEPGKHGWLAWTYWWPTGGQ